MNEQLLKIEQVCLDANSTTVLLTGVVLIILGLFLWIGGLKYLKAVTGFIGAGIGAGLGFIISRHIEVHPAAVISISTIIFAFGAMLAQQVIILVLAVLIFSLAFGTGYLDYALGKHGLTSVKTKQEQTSSEADVSDQEVSDESETKTDFFDSGNPFDKLEGLAEKLEVMDKTQQAAKTAGEYAGTFWEKMKEIFSEIKPTMNDNAGYLILWCVVGGITGLILAHLLKLLVMAFCCSVVGSSAMICGLMLGIIAKGTPVWTNLQNHHKFLTLVFGVMVAFGWLFQIVSGGGKRSTNMNTSSDNNGKE